MTCCGNLFINEFCKDIDLIIENLELDQSQKIILKNRYVKVVKFYEQKALNSGKMHNIFRTLVTTGSLFIPALLSVQQIGTEKMQEIIYWATWALSLGVTTANGYIQLFKIDRQYISYSIVSEKLKSEGWLYFQLSGKYSDTTHKDSFQAFCEKIERIKMKQVNEDFLELNKKKKKKTNIPENVPKKDIETDSASQLLNALNTMGLQNNNNNPVTALSGLMNNINNMQNTASTAIQNNLSNLQNTASNAIQTNLNSYETITKEAVKNNINSVQENIDSVQENIDSVQENIDSVQENIDSQQENKVEKIKEPEK